MLGEGEREKRVWEKKGREKKGKERTGTEDRVDSETRQKKRKERPFPHLHTTRYANKP